MRVVESGLASVLAAGLVAGSAIGVAAQQTAAESTAAAMFTAEIGWAAGCDSGISVPDSDPEHQVGWSCGPQAWTATDPRFTGSASNTWNHDVYRLEGGTYSVTVGYLAVENEGGGWICPYQQLETDSGLQSRPVDGGYIATCTGSGDYDGLSALLSLESTEGQTGVTGLVFEGELPPGPEVASE